MKNICLCIYNLASRGGEERICTLLANELHDRGYNVIVVSLCQFFYERNSFYLKPGIRQYSLRHHRVERKLFRYRFFDNIPMMRYRRILSKEMIDVVIDVDIHQTLVTAEAVRDRNIKIVSWDHFCYKRFRGWDIYEDIKKCFKSGKIAKHVVLTKADRKAHIEHEGMPQSFVSQIYNPSPIQKDVVVTHDVKRVLAVGRLQSDKGFDMLLDAWSIVEKEDSEWTLEIVGDGKIKEDLLSQCQRLKLKRVVFSRFTADIEEKYKSASIFVLSSRDEGFGLALVEAMTMGLPVVSFDCESGPKEIIRDKYNGIKVEPNNTDMLASSMLNLMKDKEMREKIGVNAYESSKQYKIETFVDQWIRLLESL